MKTKKTLQFRQLNVH